jgi:hypothetical protein
MSFSALFFAPVTRTRRVRAAPPVTSKHSTRPPYGGRARLRASTPLAALAAVRLTRIYTKTGDAGRRTWAT